MTYASDKAFRIHRDTEATRETQLKTPGDEHSPVHKPVCKGAMAPPAFLKKKFKKDFVRQ